MGDPRIIADAIDLGALLEPNFTIQRNDQSFDGAWSKSGLPLLIFADQFLDGAFYYHGGPIAGAPGGHPLQLIFWGDWWNGPGASKRALVEERTKALLQSVYFSELAQYGTRTPNFRGSTIVTKPGPPAVAPNPDDLMVKVLDLVDDLIDDDVYPDPDDGPRFIFVVMLPDTTTLGAGFPADGMHQFDYDSGFLIDEDNYWAGWIAPGLPVDPLPGDDRSVTMAIGHEVAETLTNPEDDAWCSDSQLPGRFEVCDAGVSVTAAGQIAQTAFVNGVHVQAYWSARHNATVIPIDRDYRARLTARVREVSRRRTANDTFRPDAAESAACSSIPQCCIENRDYHWRAYAVEEIARISLLTERFRRPITRWAINGYELGADRELELELNVETYAGRSPTVAKKTVKLEFTRTSGRIDIRSSGGNFEIGVESAIRPRIVGPRAKRSKGEIP